MELPGHLSPTQINMLTKCPMQWYLRYVEGIKVPPGIALILGKSFHEAKAMNGEQKVESHADLPANDVVEYFADQYDKNIALGMIWSPEEIERGREIVKGEGKDNGCAITELYMNDLSPITQPIRVEIEMNIKFIGDDVPEIKCILDEISHEVADPDKHECIRETKTAGKSPNQGTADTSLQITSYNIAFQQTYKKPPKLYYDALVKTKKPKIVTIPTTRSEDQTRQFLERVQACFDLIKNDVFMPAPTDSWWCTSKFCGYYGDACKFTR